MTRLLLAQRFRQFWNRFVRGPRRIGRIVGGTFALVFGVAFVAIAGLNAGAFVDRLDNIDSELGGRALALLLVGLTALTLVSSMSSAFHHLFLGSDLELLLAAPVPGRSLFWLKVLEIWRDSVHVLLFQAAVLIGYGRSLHVSWTYYPLALLTGVVLTVGAAAAGALLTLVLARVRFGESLLGVARVLALSFFVALGVFGVPAFGAGQRTRVSLFVSQGDVQAAADSLRALGPPPNWAPTTWATHLLLGDDAAALSLALLVVTALIAVLLSHVLFDWLYQGGWERVRFVGPSSPTARPGRPGRGWRISAPAQAQPKGPILRLLQKDWRTLLRDPRWRTSVLISLVALGLPALLLFTGDPFSRAPHTTRFWVGMVPVPYLAYLFGSQQGAATLAYEGRNLMLLRAAPVGMGRVLVAKALGGLMLVLAITWVATLALGIRHDGEPHEIGTALLAATWLAIGAVIAAVAGAALTIDVEGDNPQRRVGCVGTIVTSALSLFFFVSNAGLVVWWISRAAFLTLPRSYSMLVPIVDVLLPVLAVVSVGALAIAWSAGARRLAATETS